MIKFFRKIRRNLLTQNRFNKYLIYAIGEIILVVIGILIALQINNWNSNNIRKERESIYLANIKRDLNEQLSMIEAQILYEKNINKIATPIILNYKKTSSFKVDSTFTASIGLLSGRKTFVKNSPTYLELISSGNIDIISDKELKDQIIKYYQELERDELIINKNNNLFSDAVFVPEMLRLSEMQIVGEFTSQMVLQYQKQSSIPFVDLNEPRLKAITKKQLEKPENELRMINGVNFRNFLTIIHLEILGKQKEKTLEILEKI